MWCNFVWSSCKWMIFLVKRKLKGQNLRFGISTMCIWDIDKIKNIIEFCLDIHLVATLQIDLENDNGLSKEFAIVSFL